MHALRGLHTTSGYRSQALPSAVLCRRLQRQRRQSAPRPRPYSTYSVTYQGSKELHLNLMSHNLLTAAQSSKGGLWQK